MFSLVKITPPLCYKYEEFLIADTRKKVIDFSQPSNSKCWTNTLLWCPHCSFPHLCAQHRALSSHSCNFFLSDWSSDRSQMQPARISTTTTTRPCNNCLLRSLHNLGEREFNGYRHTAMGIVDVVRLKCWDNVLIQYKGIGKEEKKS